VKRLASTFRRLSWCESGSVAVEFAMIGLLLIAGSLITIDFGRAFFLYNKMSSAVDRAARMSLVFNATDAQLIAEILKDFPSSPSHPDQAPRVTVTTGTDFRTVNVNMAFRPVIPTFIGDALNISLARRFPKVS